MGEPWGVSCFLIKHITLFVVAFNSKVFNNYAATSRRPWTFLPSQANHIQDSYRKRNNSFLLNLMTETLIQDHTNVAVSSVLPVNSSQFTGVNSSVSSENLLHLTSEHSDLTYLRVYFINKNAKSQGREDEA